MAKFKCKNCEHTFDKFCDGANDVSDTKCPECGSHWVELQYSEKVKFNPFPRGPYDDPIYPVPLIDPWPPSAPRYWCWNIKTAPNTRYNIDNCMVHSYSTCFGKIE